MNAVIEALENAQQLLDEDRTLHYKYAVCSYSVYNAVIAELRKLEDSIQAGVLLPITHMEIVPHARFLHDSVMLFTNKEDFRNFIDLLDKGKIVE